MISRVLGFARKVRRARGKALCMASTAGRERMKSPRAPWLTTSREVMKIPGRQETELLARIMRETPSRDRGDGRATGQPQGLGAEAYLFRTSQGSRPEDARKDGHIRGRSRRFVHNAG